MDEHGRDGVLFAERDLAAPRANAAADFPVFGELQMRDFEASTRPMRIFDHVTLEYLAVNDAALALYGYSRAEFLALKLTDTRHPGEHPELFTSVSRLTRSIAHWAARRHVTKSGDVLEVETITQNVLFNGRKARLSLTIDVSGRNQLQELLLRRQQEFMTLAEHSPDIISRLDREFRHLYVNSAITTTTGRRPEAFIGRTVAEVGLAPDLVVRWQSVLREAFATGCEQILECEYAVDGASRYYESRIVPERNPGSGMGVETVLVITRDFTERRNTEIALRRGAVLAGLLESLGRATNEAMTPEAAMAACLKLICANGGWVLGHVAFYDEGKPPSVPSRSIWHVADRERFAGFIRFSESHAPNPSGSFLSRVLYGQEAVWIEDMQAEPGFGRRQTAVEHGLRCAFGFPIIVRGNVIALMEVFSEEVRERDSLALGAAQSIASQLARIVERESAHQENARTAAIVESSLDAIFSRRLDGTILTWNPGAERLFGYTAAEMVGRNASLIIPPELRPNMVVRLAQIERGVPVPAHETVRITRNGRRIHVSSSSTPIRDANGEIWGVAAIVRDITDRKLQEQELRESEERFRLLAENIDQVFWINTVAIRGNIYVSPAYEKIWGRSRESLRRDPNSWLACVHPEDLPRLREAMDGVAGGRHLDIEYRIIRPDGTLRWIRDRSYPMRRGDGTPLTCGLAEDITDLKETAAAQLERAESQRDALVREVHHRIKNSLQGVVGLLGQKIRKHPALASEIEEMMGQLQSVALVYGLQETRPDGLLSVTHILDAIISSAEDLIGGRVDRVIARESRRPACLAGSEAVSVAFALNELIFNALKHQRAAAGRKHATVTVRETTGAVEIRIRNRGKLPKGFDFSRGRAIGNGLGLVRTLLSAPGSVIVFSQGRNGVEVALELRAPLLAASQKTTRRT